MAQNKLTLPTSELPGSLVWLKDGGKPDEYVEFLLKTPLEAGHSYTLRLSCDGDYNVFAGDKLSGFGRYADFPSQLVYDEYELTADEKTPLTLLFWHIGVDSQTQKAQPAYAVYALWRDGKLVEKSGPKSLCRLSAAYAQHRCMIITGQMGPGFACDAAAAPGEYVPAKIQKLGFDAVRPRPNKKLEISEDIECRIIKEGSYAPVGGNDAAARMLSCEKLCDTTQKGRWFLFDSGRENVGFPEISFNCAEECTVDSGWGEHLADGFCRVAPGGRRFTSELRARAGFNRFYPALRRLGCRYFQLFAPCEITDVKLVFHVVSYPVSVIPSKLEGIRREIRDTAVHTLRCCMHEHYEDCPWREQAQYTLDSRNQMLAGYSVFEGGNLEMVRAALDLESRGIRRDGLMQLCFPAGKDYPIPSYTLAYFIQFNEYVQKSGDLDFAREKLPLLEAMLADIMDRTVEDGPLCGLVPRYPESAGYWNFYEWSDGMDGHRKGCDEENPPVEAPFNAFFVLALRAFSELVRSLGEADKADAAVHIADDVAGALGRVFGREDGCFDSFSDRRDVPLSVLTQALCLLAGVPCNNPAKALSLIAENGGNGAVPATLSMACWRYDALLAADRVKYAPRVLAEIDRDCAYMLSTGSTTFWETLRGEADFRGAGSLCHGWSAMAAYYYDILDDFL